MAHFTGWCPATQDNWDYIPIESREFNLRTININVQISPMTRQQRTLLFHTHCAKHRTIHAIPFF